MYTTDTREIREVKLGKSGAETNKTIRISVGNSLPFLITIPSSITEVTLATKAKPSTPVKADVELIDPEYKKDKNEDRFVFLTVAESPLTGNRALFYYDRLFKDIIILPNVAFFNLVETNHTFEIGAYCLGYGTKLVNKIPHQTIPNNNTSAYALPEVNENIDVTTLLVRIPGMLPEHLLRNNAIEEMITDKLNLVRNGIQPSVIIKLGKATDIFKTVDKLPIYLLAQSKLNEFGLEYLNNVDPGENEIYLSLTF